LINTFFHLFKKSLKTISYEAFLMYIFYKKYTSLTVNLAVKMLSIQAR
jgi:hypothetical protein